MALIIGARRYARGIYPNPSFRLGQTGPTGPAGLTGPTGCIGPTGPLGQTGPTGPAGLTGPTGCIGPTGPLGGSGRSGGLITANGGLVVVGPASFVALAGQVVLCDPTSGIVQVTAPPLVLDAVFMVGDVSGLAGAPSPIEVTSPDGAKLWNPSWTRGSPYATTVTIAQAGGFFKWRGNPSLNEWVPDL